MSNIMKSVIHIRDKSVRIFMYGDYEFQCKMYGISGASGKLRQ